MHFHDKLAEIEKRYDELTTQLSDPEVLADAARYQKAAKAHAEISDVVEKFRQWKGIEQSLRGAKELVEDPASDAEMKALAHEELTHLETQRAQVEEELRVLMLPRGSNRYRRRAGSRARRGGCRQSRGKRTGLCCWPSRPA